MAQKDLLSRLSAAIRRLKFSLGQNCTDLQAELLSTLSRPPRNKLKMAHTKSGIASPSALPTLVPGRRSDLLHLRARYKTSRSDAHILDVPSHLSGHRRRQGSSLR